MRPLILVMLAISASARPQDCEIFGDCPVEAAPVEAVCEDDIFGCDSPAPEKLCEDEVFGCDEAPEVEECEDKVFGCDDEQAVTRRTTSTTTRRTTTEEDPEDFYTSLRQNNECFDSANDIDDARDERDSQSFNDCNPERQCSFYSKDGYACANAWNCNQNNSIITDGKGLIDVRSIDSISLDASDTKCPGQDEICCRFPNYRARPATNFEPVEDKTDQAFIEDNQKYRRCGRTMQNGKVTVTGGVDDQAQPAEFPHMCVIFRKQGGQRVYIGGASLISRNLVLTVAHKFKVTQNPNNPVDHTFSIDEFSVRCGEYNVKSESSVYQAQESGVAEIYYHPQYQPRTVKNNLAVLRTKENFIYQEHVSPVCLPRPNEEFQGEKGGKCWSSGWGSDSFQEDGAFSDALRKVKLGVVNRRDCERRLRQQPRFKKSGFQLDESWMCIGGVQDEDTCKGDGGSPHVCQNNEGNWVQVGAVAWGVECGKPVPAVYSSVPHAMCWIDWVMSCIPEAEKNIDNLASGLFDIRSPETTPDSINALSASDCQRWMNSQVRLANRCEVQYSSIDERNSN